MTLHFTGRHDLLETFKALTLKDPVLLDWCAREASIIRMVDAGDEPRRVGRWWTEAERNAARYLQLRDHKAGNYCVENGQLLTGDELDAAIDARPPPTPGDEA